MRPLLRSRFSDWSNATESVPQSRRDSVVIEEDGDHEQQEFDQHSNITAALMSPNSFFSVMDHTPKHHQTAFSFNNFDGDYSNCVSRFSTGGMSCASSETFDPPSGDVPMPHTPPEQTFTGFSSGPKEEISYFTNFDMYLDRNDSDNNLVGSQNDMDMEEYGSISSMPDEVAIELTPFDLCQFPSPPGTAMRVPSEGQSAEVMMMESAILESSMEYGSSGKRSRRTETAIRVPSLADLTRARSFYVEHHHNSAAFDFGVPMSAPTTPHHYEGLEMRGSTKSWIGAMG
jgi:hypothetical protein